MKDISSVRSPSLQNLAVDVPQSTLTRRVRLVMLGSSKVGKTALVERFLGRSCPVRHRPTVEEMHELDVAVHGIKVTLEILDTSGTYEFPAMRRLAFEKGDAFLLVYSMDDPESFESIRSIRQDLKEHRTTEAPVLVVANKADLIEEQSETINETVVRLDWDYPFIQCSAMTDKEVTPAFTQILVDLIRVDESLQSSTDTIQRVSSKKKGRVVSLPPPVLQVIHPKTKVPLIKRHSCVIS